MAADTRRTSRLGEADRRRQMARQGGSALLELARPLIRLCDEVQAGLDTSPLTEATGSTAS